MYNNIPSQGSIFVEQMYMYLVQVHIHVFVMDFTEMQNYDNFSPC